MESGALPLLATGPEAGRPQLIRRAKSLARLGLGWHAIEAAVAIGAGLTAGSVALIGFGADSVVESVAGIVLLWRFGKKRHNSEAAERRAYRLIAISFWVVATYVGVEATRQLIAGDHPEASWVRDRARRGHSGDDAAARNGQEQGRRPARLRRDQG